VCRLPTLVVDVRCGSFSEVDAHIAQVCFAPINGLRQSGLSGPKSARCRLMHRNKVTYSITSSARARKVYGISRRSALAVLRLRSGQPPDACNCPIVLRDGLPTEL
jgi:hypothetical protein